MSTYNFLLSNLWIFLLIFFVNLLSLYITWKNIHKNKTNYSEISGIYFLIFLATNFLFLIYDNINLNSPKLISSGVSSSTINLLYSQIKIYKVVWFTQFIVATIIIYTLCFWIAFKHKARAYFRYRFNDVIGFVVNSKYVTDIIIYVRVSFLHLLNAFFVTVLLLCSYIPFYYSENYFHSKSQYLFDFLNFDNIGVLKTDSISGNYAAFTVSLLISVLFISYIYSGFRYFSMSGGLFTGLLFCSFLLLVFDFLYPINKFFYYFLVISSFVIFIIFSIGWVYYIRRIVAMIALFLVVSVIILTFSNNPSVHILYATFFGVIYLIISEDSSPTLIYRIFVATSILFFGLWISFSALFNGIHSFILSDTIEGWFDTDNNLGLFTLRISSLLILFDLLRFIFSEVFHLSINWRGMAITRKDELSLHVKPFSYMNYSTVYFSQIGFYVVTMLILWHFAKISYHNVLTSILNWALFFIIDDWAIIYNYSKIFKSLRSADKWKIDLFNLLMIVLSVLTLYKSQSWEYILLYVIVVLALADQKFNNVYQIDALQ